MTKIHPLDMQPVLMPYFHLYLRPRPTLYVGIMNQKPWLRAGTAYDMYGLTIGHDLCRDCRGLWLHWGQRKWGFFVKAMEN